MKDILPTFPDHDLNILENLSQYLDNKQLDDWYAIAGDYSTTKYIDIFDFS